MFPRSASFTRRLLVAGLLAAVACSSDDPPSPSPDGGLVDTGSPSGLDGGLDAGETDGGGAPMGIVIDGDLSDWTDSSVVLRNPGFAGEGVQGPDLRFEELRMYGDADFLYVGYRFRGGTAIVHLDTRPGGPLSAASFEAWPRRVSFDRGVDYFIAQSADSAPEVRYVVNATSAPRVPGVVESAVSGGAPAYTTELKIPWDALGLAVRSSKTITVYVGAYGGDGEGAGDIAPSETSTPAVAGNTLQPSTPFAARFVGGLQVDFQQPGCDDSEVTGCPLRVLFVIDGSASQQFLDAMNRRAAAVADAVRERRDDEDASFAVIRFNESLDVLTLPTVSITVDDPLGVDLTGAFTRDSAVLQMATEGLRVADSVTDALGAWYVARRVLGQDMAGLSDGERGRARYAVIYLTDGEPLPACCSQASLDAGTCARGDNHISFCDAPDAIRQNDRQLPFLVGDEDYNLPYQILPVAAEIAELARRERVGQLSLHTSFLFDPSALTPSTTDGCFDAPGVRICPAPVRSLLTQIAELGNGTFREYATADDIDFAAIVAGQLED